MTETAVNWNTVAAERTMTRVVELIEKTTGEVIDKENLPFPTSLNDLRVRKTWALLCSADTAELFPVGSDAETVLMQALQPERLADLRVVIALSQPAPLAAGIGVGYLDRKARASHGADFYAGWTELTYEQALLASVLHPTYGLFVYQEQLTQIGTVVAGFDSRMNSLLRQAASRKDSELWETVRRAFLHGARLEKRDLITGQLISSLFQLQTADRMFASMRASVGYAVSAEYCAAVAQQLYALAFLKANWPDQYAAITDSLV